MKHCCVIGGTGFIGSEVVKLLVTTGRKVTVIGRSTLPSRPLPQGVEYISHGYGDAEFLAGFLKGVDEVIDLAYSTVPKTSYDDPVNDISSNLPCVVKLFEAACSAGIKKLLLVSSGGTVYGKTNTTAINEEHATNPICPYGITKLVTEKYAMMFNHLYDLPIVSVRPSNAFGPGQLPFCQQGFIATAIASILKDKEVVVFGEEGTVRDYVYVIDVARGILAALDKGKIGTCYNIGSTVGRSNREVLDVISALAQSHGVKPEIKILAPRKFDVPWNVLDCDKLYSQTGWRPQVSFEEGIENTWYWLREHLQT